MAQASPETKKTDTTSKPDEKDFNKEVDSIKDDLKKLQADLKRLTDASTEMGADLYNTAREKLEIEANKLMEHFQETAGDVKGQGKKVMQDVEQRVEEKPVSSVLMTLGIGFALGWLIGRK